MEKKPLATNTSALSVMEKLKLETKANHTQTEQVSNMKRLFANDYSLAEYQQHLEKMYGYLTGVEPLLQQALDDELRTVMQARSRRVWLKQDLLNFGLTDAQISALPVCTAPAYINSLPHSLGAYYVLEGSSLGGQVICKHLSQHFGEAVTDKLHFYQGHGEQTRGHWQQFAELINARFPDASQPEAAEMVKAAQLTFDSIADWLKTSSV